MPPARHTINVTEITVCLPGARLIICFENAASFSVSSTAGSLPRAWSGPKPGRSRASARAGHTTGRAPTGEIWVSPQVKLLIGGETVQ
jgi:hypothetical protein